MSNRVWDLIGKCWSQDPSSRPQIEDVVKKTRELQDVDASVSQNDDSSQQPSVDPSPCSGHLPLYSIQSTNEPPPQKLVTTTYIAIELPLLNNGSRAAFLSDVTNKFNYSRLKSGYGECYCTLS